MSTSTTILMIKTASELLTAFILAERKNVESINMSHMPTLGTAYERIVSSGIDSRFVLPPGLGLKVVSGFIQGLPNQIDCMLVRGDGVRYGLTDEYIYPIDQVLCVLEVKKTLYKSEFQDGMAHLAAVQNLFLRKFADEHWRLGESAFDHARLSFSRITGRAAPSPASLDTVPVADRMLFATLARQMYAPITVLLGFDGYTTEQGLRTALNDLLDSDLGRSSSATPDFMPNLVSVGDFSLIKCTGQPYVAWDDNDEWVTVVSCRHNPAQILLEVLWTKIDRFCDVRMPFGPISEKETLEKAIACRAVERENVVGWEFTTTEKSERFLKDRPAATPWLPCMLSKPAVSMVQVMAISGSIELDAGLKSEPYQSDGGSMHSAVAELIRTSVVRLEGRFLEIATSFVLAELEDGTGLIAKDRERLDQWCVARDISASFTTIVKIQ